MKTVCADIDTFVEDGGWEFLLDDEKQES